MQFTFYYIRLINFNEIKKNVCAFMYFLLYSWQSSRADCVNMEGILTRKIAKTGDYVTNITGKSSVWNEYISVINSHKMFVITKN